MSKCERPDCGCSQSPASSSSDSPDASGAIDRRAFLAGGAAAGLGAASAQDPQGPRADLFLDVAADIVASREAEIEFVDMRYSNGFTIGWKGGSQSPVTDSVPVEGGMVAELAN